MFIRIFGFSAILFFVVLLLISCANEVRPTGGPRDTLPPLLVNSTPQNKSLNFSGNIILLEFNEFIKADKLNNQLLITPTINSSYKVKTGSKKIQLKFDETNPFQSNTTYTFNFQKSILDLTEGNVWENSKLVFSTGDFLDSLYIKGIVLDLLTKKPIDNCVVSIYSIEDTLNALTGKPMYFTMTNKQGQFILENLVPRTYRIYSILDKNNNLTIDASTESYGFLPEPIVLKDSAINIELNNIVLNINELRLVTARPIRYYFDISFNKNIIDYDLAAIPDDLTIYSNLQDKNTKIRIYNTLPQADSIFVKLSASDSIGNTIYDSLYVKFAPSTLKRENFSHSMLPENNKEIHSDFSGTISFNKPVLTVKFDSIYFSYDSTTFENVSPDEISFNKQRDKIFINKKLNVPVTQKPPQIVFYASPASFISVEGDSSRLIQQKYRLLDPVNYGTIKGTINIDSGQFFVQLLDTSYKLIMESKNSKSYIFTFVPPGSYYVRLMVDSDSSGAWEPGNILENKLPEPVFFYRNELDSIETISIKANWEITDINLSAP